MTHPSINVALRVALAIMVLRLILFFVNADFPYQDETFLFILLTSFPALVLYGIWPREKKSSFKDDALMGMRLTLVFSIALALFIYAFYAFVDQDYFPNMQDMIVARELAANPDVVEEELRTGVTNFFSVRNFSVMAVLLFLVMSAFYSVLFSVVKRLVIK